MLASPHWVIRFLCNLYDNDQVPWGWLPWLGTPLHAQIYECVKIATLLFPLKCSLSFAHAQGFSGW